MKRKRNKLLGLLFLTVMLLGLMSMTTFAQGENVIVTSDKTEPSQGEEFTVTLKIDNSFSNFAAGEFWLLYDTELLDYVSCEKGETILPSNLDLVERASQDGRLIFASGTRIGNEPYDPGKPYFTATFRVKKGVAAGTDVTPWLDTKKSILGDSSFNVVEVNPSMPTVSVKGGTSTGSNGGGGGGSKESKFAITVEQAENGAVKADVSTAAKGDTVTLTATPATGYGLDKITVTEKEGNDVTLTKKDDTVFTFVMPEKAVTVKAAFRTENKDNNDNDNEEKPPVVPKKGEYSDIKADRWSKADIAYVVEKGLMFGVTDIEFGPARPTTRGMIVTILYRLEGSPATEGINPFHDVAAGSYYEKAVIWGAKNGIVAGFGEGKFCPNDDITREQLAAIFYRYASFKGYDVSAVASLTGYNDAGKVSAYAVKAMQWATGAELLKGDNNNLMPGGKATREQVAAILHRFCEKVAG